MSSAQGRVERLCRAVVVLLAAATATSWLQIGAVAFRREVLGVFSWKWALDDQLFLTSAGYLTIFALVGLVPVIGHLRWPQRYGLAALSATLAGFGAFSAFLVFERIAGWAWLILGIGVGVRTHRAMARRPDTAWRWTWRMALGGHLATGLVVGWQAAANAGSGWPTQPTPAAARAGAPNILLLVMDTERAGSMSLYGAPVTTTPYQDQLARQAVVFDAAYSTAPWTLPSHASIFTGRYPSEVGADWMAPLDGGLPTLAETLQAQGYATGGFVANLLYAASNSGLARGFQHYEDARRSWRQAILGTTLAQSGSATRALAVWDESRWFRGALEALWPLTIRPASGNLRFDPKSAESVAADFLRWLPTEPDRPFFAFLNLFDAHAPYLPPTPYRTMFGSAGLIHDRYRGAIRYLDDTVAGLLGELDRRGLLANTIVVITSDHGEMFGEHGAFSHGNGVYRPELHVPLLVLHAPGALPGTRVTQSVSLRDLAVTLLDVAGVPNTTGLGGVSLRPLLAGAPTVDSASPVLSELSERLNPETGRQNRPELKSLIGDASHLIANADGTVQLFAYPSDTAEVNDLSGSMSAREAAIARLRQVLATEAITWERGPRR